jgi:hypothetical protein
MTIFGIASCGAVAELATDDAGAEQQPTPAPSASSVGTNGRDASGTSAQDASGTPDSGDAGHRDAATCAIEASADAGLPPAVFKTASAALQEGAGGFDYGRAVALSADGTTLVVGSQYDNSASTANPFDTSARGAGAVWVYSFASPAGWSQQAYLKTSNLAAQEVDTGVFIIAPNFGESVSLSADGNTMVVGAPHESSPSTGVDGDQLSHTAQVAGAAYVFERNAGSWTQTHYLKASNTIQQSEFGSSVAISADGNTLVVGAIHEGNGASGVNGPETGSSVPFSGAAYVFVRSDSTWVQQAYLKASNPRSNGWFGTAIAISGDGNLVAVSANDSSSASGVNGDQSDTSAPGSGAVYLFSRTGGVWSQAAYIKASNTRAQAQFGVALSFSADGSTLAVGARGESSASSGVNANQADTSASGAGAVYVFVPSANSWAQQVYLKSSYARAPSGFGSAVALTADGSGLLVTAPFDKSNAKGINGNQCDSSLYSAGAAYWFTRTGGSWSQQSYLKPTLPMPSQFGMSGAVSSSNPSLLAIGANDTVYLFSQ